MGFFVTHCDGVSCGVEIDLGVVHFEDKPLILPLLLLMEMHDFCGYYFLYMIYGQK